MVMVMMMMMMMNKLVLRYIGIHGHPGTEVLFSCRAITRVSTSTLQTGRGR